MASIKADATKHKCSQMEIVKRAIQGENLGGLKPAQKKKLKPFVDVIAKLRKQAKAGDAVPDLITTVVEEVRLAFPR